MTRNSSGPLHKTHLVVRRSDYDAAQPLTIEGKCGKTYIEYRSGKHSARIDLSLAIWRQSTKIRNPSQFQAKERTNR
jgi:hypothetical protein